jgi:flagellar biosynthesis chaperone FliJ
MDTSFRFRFQRILDIKRKQEQLLEIEVARLDRLIMDWEAAGERWQRIKAEALQTLRKARETVDLELNARYTAYLPHVRKQLKRCALEADALRQDKAHVVEKLQKIMQSRKMLEKYRDKLMRASMLKAERAEERALDSHSIEKFVRAAAAQSEGEL